MFASATLASRAFLSAVSADAEDFSIAPIRESISSKTFAVSFMAA